jgi:hypothetical protein
MHIKVPKINLANQEKRVLAWMIKRGLYFCSGCEKAFIPKEFHKKFMRTNADLGAFAWVDSVELRQEKVETELDKFKRLKAHAEKMVERYKARSELTAKLLKKWRRKLKYYTKRVSKLENARKDD